jgi:CheY-like chemotaxis protein
MPGMNGLELAQTVRQALPRARVVFMTAYGDGAVVQDQIRARQLDAYLRKPFSLKQVRDIVQATSAAVA